MKILTIIPARGGSVGIPGKNIIEINGKPLIAYSIIPAINILHQGLVDKVIVSTDSEEIAEIASTWGAEVPFLRPKEISGNTSKSVEFIKHALDHYANEGIYFDAVLILQPTSPMRTEVDLKNAIELFKSNKNDSLISTYEEEYINDLVIYKLDKDKITSIPVNPLHNKGIRRQDHGSTFVRNGCIYITTRELVEKGLVIGDSPLMYIMEKSRSINVDTNEDLEMLKKLV